MKASGKIGSNGVKVSDNVEKRFEPDIYIHVHMIMETGSEDSNSTGKLYRYFDSAVTAVAAVHIGRLGSGFRFFERFHLYKTEHSDSCANYNLAWRPKFVQSIHLCLFVRAKLIVKKCVYLHISLDNKIYLFFGTRGKISNPNRTFNAEFKCVSSFSPSPTVCL